MGDVDSVLREVKAFYGIDENIEELLRYLIDEKLKRYIQARMEEEKSGSIEKDVTQLEDSLASLVEKYMKLKYPERFKTVRVKNDNGLNNVSEEELKRIEMAFFSEEEE